MTPDMIEIYFCPRCFKIGKILCDYFVLGSPMYTCRCTCDECGTPLRIIDNLDRCDSCYRRVQCLGEPTPITTAVAVIMKLPGDDIGNRTFTKVVAAALRDIKGTLNKYGTQCLKEDLETTQREIYGSRKNISN